jgi:Flp pilus assembly protein TadG
MMMRRMVAKRGTPQANGDAGQSLVEFAIIIPMFLVLLFGLLDAGRYVYMRSVLSQAAREGARAAAVEASWLQSTAANCNTVGGPVCPANAAALTADATAAANRMVAPFGSVSALYISCDPPGSAPTGAWTSGTACTSSSGTTGNLVSVRVLLTYNPITPVGTLIPLMLGAGSAGSFTGPITASGSSTMVVN